MKGLNLDTAGLKILLRCTGQPQTRHCKHARTQPGPACQPNKVYRCDRSGSKFSHRHAQASVVPTDCMRARLQIAFRWSDGATDMFGPACRRRGRVRLGRHRGRRRAGGGGGLLLLHYIGAVLDIVDITGCSPAGAHTRCARGADARAEPGRCARRADARAEPGRCAEPMRARSGADERAEPMRARSRSAEPMRAPSRCVRASGAGPMRARSRCASGAGPMSVRSRCARGTDARSRCARRADACAEPMRARSWRSRADARAEPMRARSRCDARASSVKRTTSSVKRTTSSVKRTASSAVRRGGGDSTSIPPSSSPAR